MNDQFTEEFISQGGGGQKKKHSVFLLVFCCFAIFGAVLAALFFFKVLKSPEAALLKAFKATRTLSSQSVKLNALLKFQTNNGPWTVAAELVSDHRYPGRKPQMKGNMKMNISGNAGAFQLEDANLDILISEEDSLYFNLYSPKNLFAADLKPILNTWVEVKLAEIPVPEKENIYALMFYEREKWQEAFFDAYGKYPFLNMSLLSSADAGGERVASFSFQSDPERFKVFFRAYLDRVFPKSGESDGGESQKIREEMTKNANAIADNIAISGDMRIGEKSNLLYSLNLFIKNSDGSGNLLVMNFPEKMEFTLVFSNWNQKMEILPPQEALAFEEAFQRVSGLEWKKFAANTNNLPQDTNARELDSDSDGLPDTMEERLLTDKLNPDTDGDGYSDGVEFDNGYNPLGSGRMKF